MLRRGLILFAAFIVLALLWPAFANAMPSSKSSTAPGNRLAVTLVADPALGHAADGARIEVLLSDGRRLTHDVVQSAGGTQPDWRVGFGQANILQLSVRWPDTFTDVSYDVPAGSAVRWGYGTNPAITPLPAGADAGAFPVMAEPGDATSTASYLPRALLYAAAGMTFVLLAFGWLRARLRPVAAAGPAAALPLSPWAAALAANPPRRSVSIRGQVYPVILPSIRDPRLVLTAAVGALHVLGQTVLNFNVSIAQILIPLVTCAAIEFTYMFVKEKKIAWPASALQTGNGIAFILRIPGTQHGDWWSLNGWYYSFGIAAFSIGSKYLIRSNGRHIFNPSNLGLGLAFLILGTSRVEPIDFWWGPLGPGVIAGLCIIATGAALLLFRLRLFWMSFATWASLAAGLAVVALAGHAMSARWSFEPVTGRWFWTVILTSPELFLFLCFMMTDPQTTPAGRVGRVVFGTILGLTAAAFIAPQQTEFWSKVGLINSLVVCCALRPYIERLCPAAGTPEDNVRTWLAGLVRGPRERIVTGAGWAWGTGAARTGIVLGTLALLLLAFIPMSSPARFPVGGVEAASALVARPAVDSATLPQVTIDPTFKRLNAGDPQATTIAHDVAADLSIEALAIRNSDGEIAKTASAGVRLQAVLNQIDADRRNLQTTLITYSYDSMKLVPVFDPANNQAGPQFGLELHGTKHQTTYERAGGGMLNAKLSETDTPIALTFALLRQDGKFLIAADYPAVE